MSYWFYLWLHIRRNWSLRQNWVLNRCRIFYRWWGKLIWAFQINIIYILYIYILTSIRYFILFSFCVNLMFSIIYMYASYKYYSSIHFSFLFWWCNVWIDYLIDLYIIFLLRLFYFVNLSHRIKTVSNVATFSSPTDRAQIISNYSIFSTSAFSWFESNIQYPTTLIAWFALPIESINCTRVTCSLISFSILKEPWFSYLLCYNTISVEI